jgi:hypothetical protein
MFSFCKKWKGSCSCFFDKFLNKDWSECCKKHDEDYELLGKASALPPSDIINKGLDL